MTKNHLGDVCEKEVTKNHLTHLISTTKSDDQLDSVHVAHSDWASRFF